MASCISLLKLFRRIRKEHGLSSYAVDLYLVLLGECHNTKWKNPFFVSSKSITEETGMSKPTLCKARRELKESNLIDFTDSPGGKIPTKYTLLTVNVANGDTASTVNDIYGDMPTVSEINGNTPLTVNVANGDAKENTPIPLKENKYIYNQEGERDAHARTREGQDFIDSLKRDPLWLEESIRACAGVEDSFDEICLRVVQQWEAFGEDFGARDARKKFRNWLLKEADGLRRRLASAKSESLQERKRKFRDEIAAAAQIIDVASETLNDFYQYWTQPTPDGGSLAFETKTFWDTKSRLHRWIQKERTRGA